MRFCGADWGVWLRNSTERSIPIDILTRPFRNFGNLAKWKSEGKLIKDAVWSDVSNDGGAKPGAIRPAGILRIHPDLEPIPPIPADRQSDPLLARYWREVVGVGGRYQLAIMTKKENSELRKLRDDYKKAFNIYSAALAR